MSSNQGKYGVFISYCHEDAQYVSPIVEIISASRPDLVFQDTKQIVKGKKWGPQLQEAMEQSTLVIVFWCKHSAQSQYVKNEYERAIQTKKDILPVLLDDCELNPDLADYQWIDLQHVTTHKKYAASSGTPFSILRSQKLVVAIIAMLLFSAVFFFMQKSTADRTPAVTLNIPADSVSLDTARLATNMADTASIAMNNGDSTASQLRDLVFAKKKNQQEINLLVQQVRRQDIKSNGQAERQDPSKHWSVYARRKWTSNFQQLSSISDSLNQKINSVYSQNKSDLSSAQAIKKVNAQQKQMNQTLVQSAFQQTNDTLFDIGIQTSRSLDDSLVKLIAKEYPATNVTSQFDSLNGKIAAADSNYIKLKQSNTGKKTPEIIAEQTNDKLYKHPVFIALMLALLLGGIAVARKMYQFIKKPNNNASGSTTAAETLITEINLKLPPTVP